MKRCSFDEPVDEGFHAFRRLFQEREDDCALGIAFAGAQVLEQRFSCNPGEQTTQRMPHRAIPHVPELAIVRDSAIIAAPKLSRSSVHGRLSIGHVQAFAEQMRHTKSDIECRLAEMCCFMVEKHQPLANHQDILWAVINVKRRASISATSS